ncbi:MAG: type II toxin-antitoxin system PemK/MazF family toxin [Candidatus Dadabacteria bacterium]|nr:type II toxin-antitoxin system PemK/MazF family toxin [Candidatus Dadabacteria bacterium]NIX16662.1 type II toxin-antitoxin system PemK/MazF family toxin [Candidatus Dadabacteria bacterium]NIY23228.1 type II toxin-antitoxin system PemK/MazF family toxin [Candidatus Dadabacteria bacterium]
MTSYKKWDIVLVPFPFTDLKTTKKRPALVIYPDNYNKVFDLVILFITSQMDIPRRPGDYHISEWKKCGLPKPSMIRMKFATIHKSIVVKTIGKLTKQDAKGLTKNLIEFLS